MEVDAGAKQISAVYMNGNKGKQDDQNNGLAVKKEEIKTIAMAGSGIVASTQNTTNGVNGKYYQ